MTTTIEDNELRTELQELYLVSKQWMSDLEFIDNEINFFKKIIAQAEASPLVSEDVKTLRRLRDTHSNLKKRITNYIHQLEPLITESSQAFRLYLIENHAELYTGINSMLVEIKMLKAHATTYTKKSFCLS